MSVSDLLPASASYYSSLLKLILLFSILRLPVSLLTMQTKNEINFTFIIFVNAIFETVQCSEILQVKQKVLFVSKAFVRVKNYHRVKMKT